MGTNPDMPQWWCMYAHFPGHFPLSNLYESLMFLSWGVSTVPIALERQVAYGVSTGAIFAPLVCRTPTLKVALRKHAEPSTHRPPMTAFAPNIRGDWTGEGSRPASTPTRRDAWGRNHLVRDTSRDDGARPKF